MRLMPSHSTSGIRGAAPAGTQSPLAVYSAHYEALRSRLRRQGVSHRTLLYSVHEAAAYAAGHHPGRFTDGAVENVALELGAELQEGAASLTAAATLHAPRGSRRRRVLHVASTVMPVGGLTRMIHHWVRHDASSCHSLVLTDQRRLPVSDWLAKGVIDRGGGLASMPVSVPLPARAQCLRQLAREWADVVVLHHASSDLVPVLAFAAGACPPVCVLNHADHMFWLGTSVADAVIDLRDVGARISRQRRFARRIAVLPIPLELPPRQVTRGGARESLGIPHDRLMLLSVGRAVKYRPTVDRDFFGTLHKVLAVVPGAHLYVVGINSPEAARYGLKADHDRVHLCGSVEDPSAFRAAADVYLEPFPFGSATAVLEAALAGLPVVLPYAPLADVLVTNHGLENLLSHARDEAEYVGRIGALCRGSAERAALGAAMGAHCRAHHTGEPWQEHLDAVYEAVAGLRHEPQPVPVTACEDSPLDRALASWQAECRPQRDAHQESRQAMRSLCVNYARRVRDAGGHGDAMALLSRGVGLWGCDRQVALALAKIPVHFVAGLLKSAAAATR